MYHRIISIYILIRIIYISLINNCGFFFKCPNLGHLNYLFFEILLLKHYSPHHSTNLRIRQIGSHLQFFKIRARKNFIFPVNKLPFVGHFQQYFRFLQLEALFSALIFSHFVVDTTITFVYK